MYILYQVNSAKDQQISFNQTSAVNLVMFMGETGK